MTAPLRFIFLLLLVISIISFALALFTYNQYVNRKTSLIHIQTPLDAELNSIHLDIEAEINQPVNKMECVKGDDHLTLAAGFTSRLSVPDYMTAETLGTGYTLTFKANEDESTVSVVMKKDLADKIRSAQSPEIVSDDLQFLFVKVAKFCADGWANAAKWVQ